MNRLGSNQTCGEHHLGVSLVMVTTRPSYSCQIPEIPRFSVPSFVPAVVTYLDSGKPLWITFLPFAHTSAPRLSARGRGFSIQITSAGAPSLYNKPVTQIQSSSLLTSSSLSSSSFTLESSMLSTFAGNCHSLQVMMIADHLSTTTLSSSHYCYRRHCF